jgi:hypothetical protein
MLRFDSREDGVVVTLLPPVVTDSAQTGWPCGGTVLFGKQRPRCSLCPLCLARLWRRWSTKRERRTKEKEAGDDAVSYLHSPSLRSFEPEKSMHLHIAVNAGSEVRDIVNPLGLSISVPPSVLLRYLFGKPKAEESFHREEELGSRSTGPGPRKHCLRRSEVNSGCISNPGRRVCVVQVFVIPVVPFGPLPSPLDPSFSLTAGKSFSGLVLPSLRAWSHSFQIHFLSFPASAFHHL